MASKNKEQTVLANKFAHRFASAVDSGSIIRKLYAFYLSRITRGLEGSQGLYYLETFKSSIFSPFCLLCLLSFVDFPPFNIFIAPSIHFTNIFI